MNTNLIGLINALHDQAMDQAELADSLAHRAIAVADLALHGQALEAYQKAYRLECQAAEMIPKTWPTTESEPSRSLMYESAMHLAVNAGLMGAAQTIANHILSFSRYAEVREAAQSFIDSVVPGPTTESQPLNP